MLMGSSVAHAFDAGQLEYRYGLLKRGANLHYWVEEKDGALINLDAATNQIHDDDIARLRRLGFTHVRFAISPYPLLQELRFQEENLRAPAAVQFLGEIHRIIKICLAHDMAVVLAVMPRDDVYDKLYKDPAYEDEWAGFFWHWGREFAMYDPNRLLFETLNEPSLYYRIKDASGVDADDYESMKKLIGEANARWQSMQEKFFTALRAHAKEHTLIATAEEKSSAYALTRSAPVSDPNVIYGFHYYDPFLFTHQGADWVQLPAQLESLTYPSYAANCRMVKKYVKDYNLKAAVEDYCNVRWMREAHESRLKKLKEWADANKVKVWAGEFGAFPSKAEKSSLYNYLDDVRTVLEQYGFGWCVWEYAGWLGKFEDMRLRDVLGVE